MTLIQAININRRVILFLTDTFLLTFNRIYFSFSRYCYLCTPGPPHSTCTILASRPRWVSSRSCPAACTCSACAPAAAQCCTHSSLPFLHGSGLCCSGTWATDTATAGRFRPDSARPFSCKGSSDSPWERPGLNAARKGGFWLSCSMQRGQSGGSETSPKIRFSANSWVTLTLSTPRINLWDSIGLTNSCVDWLCTNSIFFCLPGFSLTSSYKKMKIKATLTWAYCLAKSSSMLILRMEFLFYSGKGDRRGLLCLCMKLLLFDCTDW